MCRGAWWATVYSATKSQTQLNQLSMHEHRYRYKYGLLRWLRGKESACQCRKCRRCVFDPQVRKIPYSRKWQPALVFLLGKCHGQRSLVGYSQWGCKELDVTGDWEQMHRDIEIYPYPICSVSLQNFITGSNPTRGIAVSMYLKKKKNYSGDPDLSVKAQTLTSFIYINILQIPCEIL